MRIEIIGNKGVVGNATFELFKRLGYNVTGSDKESKVNLADIYFVCTPEDTVEKIVKELTRNKIPIHLGNNVFIVIRSTVAPGTCKNLAQNTGYAHICHNPEFLREATALQDEFSPARTVIGECCEKHGQMLEQLYKPLQRPIVRTDTTTSELVKLASNAFLSCVLSFWNTIEEISKRADTSGHKVGMITSLDPRISSYGSRLHNKYGGRCLPKDIKQLIQFAEKMGYDPTLLKAIEGVNGK